MKPLNKIALAILALGSALPLSAQIFIGVRGGAHLSNVKATETLESLTPDFRFAPGGTAGVTAEFGITDWFAVQPEINWTQKGFNFDEGIDFDLGNLPIEAGADVVFRTNYLELPVLGKFKFGNDVVKGYVAAGPQVGYALDAQLITTPRIFFELDPIRTDIDFENLDYNRVEFSGVGVLGVEFNLNRIKIFADARYTHGFTELYNFPYVNEQLKHRGLTFGAGVAVNLIQPAAQTKASKRPPVRKPPTYRPRPSAASGK